MENLLDGLRASFVVIGPLCAIIMALGGYILRNALSDLKDLQSTKVSLETFKEVSKEVEDLTEMLKSVNSRLEDKFATQERVRNIEIEVRTLRSDVTDTFKMIMQLLSRGD